MGENHACSVLVLSHAMCHSLEDAQTVLTPQERTQFERVAPQQRHDWLSGRMAAKSLVVGAGAELLKVSIRPECVQVTNHPWGQPAYSFLGEAEWLNGLLPAHLSISHTAGQGFAALSNHPVGIDAEVDSPVQNARVRRIQAVWGLPGDGVTEWCLTEALLKATGAGWDAVRKGLSIRPGPSGTVELRVGESAPVPGIVGAIDDMRYAVVLNSPLCTEVKTQWIVSRLRK